MLNQKCQLRHLWLIFQTIRMFIKLPALLKRLDDFVVDIGLAPDFIKSDVEGAELMVYQGGIESKNHYKPIIFQKC